MMARLDGLSVSADRPALTASPSVRAVCPQRFLDARWRGAGPPFLVLHHDIETDALRKIDPQVAELAEARSQHFVSQR
jgi:hypothetical protein